MLLKTFATDFFFVQCCLFFIFIIVEQSLSPWLSLKSEQTNKQITIDRKTNQTTSARLN